MENKDEQQEQLYALAAYRDTEAAGCPCAAAEMLQSHPREQKLYQALKATYPHPAPTQEAAAELLNLPFGTYRRHLKSGIERITEILWQWEVSGVRKVTHK